MKKILLLTLLTLSIAGCGAYQEEQQAQNQRSMEEVQMETTKPETIEDVPEIDPNAKEYVPPKPTKTAKGVAIPGRGKIKIPAGQKDNLNVKFHNPESNADYYYMVYELRLGDEVLYKSNRLDPGEEINTINLSRSLTPGTYDATIFVQPYRMEDDTATNNAVLEIELLVE